MNFSHVFCILVLLGCHEKYYGVQVEATKTQESFDVSKSDMKAITSILGPLFTTIADKTKVSKSNWFGGYGKDGCKSKDLLLSVKRIVRHLANNNGKKRDVDNVVNTAIEKIQAKNYDFNTSPIISELKTMRDCIKECKPIHYEELEKADYGQTFQHGTPLRESYPEGYFDNSESSADEEGY